MKTPTPLSLNSKSGNLRIPCNCNKLLNCRAVAKMVRKVLLMKARGLHDYYRTSYILVL